MNRLHSMDNEFGERLHNYSLEPPMHIWDQIDQKRDWKHKLFNHLRLKWQIYGLSALGIALFGSVLLLSTTSNPEVQFFPIPLLDGTAALVAENKAKQAEDKATIQLAKETTKEKNQQLDIAKTSTINSSKTKNKETSITAITSSHTNNIKTELPAPVTKSSEEIAENAEIAESVVVLEEKEEVLAEEVPQMPEEVVQEEFEEASANTNNILNAFLLPNDLKLLETNYSLGNKLRITDTECAKFGPKKGQVFIDFILSPDIALREMSPRNAEYTEYLRAREASESSVFAYSAGLRLSVVSGMGFVMRSGINYSQINEKFEHIDENYERTEIIKITNSAGEVIGMDTIVEFGTRIRTTHNRLQTIDLPIILGYELYYEKFAFSINGGPYLNLRFTQKGSFLSPTDLEPVSFSSNDPNGIKAFKKQLGIGWYGSLGFQYNLKKKLFLLIEPYFKIYPKSFTDENFAVRQRYFTTGLSVGIRRQL